jgi:hypothetical protein
VATTVPKAFAEFAETIKPTAAQEQTVATRRNSVRDFLLAKYPAGSVMPLTETRVIGSAGRKTLIRPVDDVDVFCVFDDSQVWSSYRNDSRQLLYRVREALTNYRVQTVGSRGQAVRLFYTSGPNVDITPAFPVFNAILRTPAGYYIPRGDGGWQQTDPYKHHDFMAQRNLDLGYHLKPLVRLLKRWNRTHSSRIRSFHLELVAQATFTSLGGNMREATRIFFEHAYTHLHVQDPAGYSGDLASGLTAIQELNIKQSFVNAADHARRAQLAEALGSVQEALRQWRIVFGNEFPGYG